jgi:hypothetical protein
MTDRKWFTVNINESTKETLINVRKELEKTLGIEVSWAQAIQFLANEYMKGKK